MKTTQLKCPACGSTELEKHQWNEYRCSHCASMLKLDSEGRHLELIGLVCLQCNSNNPVGRRFCGKCGAKLVRACPRCKIENPFDMQFCGSCGFDYTLRAEWEKLQRELAFLQKELDRETGKGFRWNRKREAELHLRMSELERIGATPASLREWANKREMVE